MNPQQPRFLSLFFEVFEALPRQGPGNRASAAKALALCDGLPPEPAILDLGCGVGMQTLHLAELTAGTILAVDSHAPGIRRLTDTLAEKGLTTRVQAWVGDMAALDHPPASFDLVWSEGALYNIGLTRAFELCRQLLRPGGYLVFTDAVWRKESPPAEVMANFDAEYPDMGRMEDVLRKLRECGLEAIDHFTLPDEAWWEDFYTPMEHRIETLRKQYSEDAEAATILDEIALEPELHRRYADYYAYEFFVARKPCR